jgi:anhydro-N-acetylmuramic acid kinase
MPDYYIGLISGTSMDGIDAVLVEFGDRSLRTIAANSHPYPEELRAELMTASRNPQSCTVDVLGSLDHWTGECFRDAALGLLRESGNDASQVRAIGSHGQTVRHRPNEDRPFTIQIGNPNVIAKGTGIFCVADFRSADVALGGQGAPLTPPFHEWLFRSEAVDRCVVNIGGIANITLLPCRDGAIGGFDTGPGNTLLDAWTLRHQGKAYDESGQWAASGSCDNALLERMLADPYFSLPPPKSTGFEYFNEAWLSSLGVDDHDSVAVQATLCELSAKTIAAAINARISDTGDVLVCGGGVHNAHLMQRLSANLAAAILDSTADHGLDPDWVEASAFAWLAMRTLDNLPGNAPGVTGASRAAILGAVYPAG